MEKIRKKQLILLLIGLMSILIGIIYMYGEGVLGTKKQVPEVTPSTQYHLPVFVIDAHGEAIGEDMPLVVDVQLYEGQAEANPIADEPVLVTQANIKIRGNSTRAFPKKQYSLELMDEQGGSRNEALLGMAKESDWVLNAPFADKSLMRNYVAYTTARQIMEYAPDARFCEVFLVNDGAEQPSQRHYQGVYLLIEKIKIGEDRVDIYPSHEDRKPSTFIVQRNPVESEGDLFIPTYGSELRLYDYGFEGVYPKREISEEHVAFISKTISQFERILYGQEFTSPKVGYKQFVDSGSFVDYFIINEFFKNTDSGLLSTYFYMDVDQRLKAGPVWDFNRSLGNAFIKTDQPFDNTGFFMTQKPWFDRLLLDVDFVEQVINRYRILRKTFLSEAYLFDLIDKAVETLGPAIERNFSIWPFELCQQADAFKHPYFVMPDNPKDLAAIKHTFEQKPYMLIPADNQAQSYEEEIAKMKQFIKERGTWLDEHIEALYKWTT